MRLPIRVRLAAAFAATLAIVLALVGSFVYVRFRADENRAIDTELLNRTTSFFAAPNPNPQLRIDLLGSSDEQFGQVIDRAGRVAATSAQLTPRPFAGAALGFRYAAVMTRRERRRVRLLVTRHGDTTLILASALDDRDDALRSLRNLLWRASALTLAAASLLAWALAAAALRPVERLRAEAGSFSTTELTIRLAVPKSDDELHRLAVTLNNMLDRIQDSFERQRSFVDNASHELRTPLANLRMELELALRQERSEAQLLDALQSAATESSRLDRLASNLLTLARTADGLLPIRREPIDLAALVRDTTATFAARAAADGVALHTDGDVDGLVAVDPLRVGQALTNLLDNALRVTPRGGSVTVAVSASSTEIIVAVMDTGPGFSTKLATSAFGLFVRGPSDQRSSDGAGLGLAIVAAVAESHGGRATIDTTVRGSTVSIHLPTQPSLA